MDGTEVLKRVRSEVVDIADRLPLADIADHLALADIAEHVPFADRLMASRRRSRIAAWRTIAPWLAFGALVAAVAIAYALVRRGDTRRSDDTPTDVSGTGEVPSRMLGGDADRQSESRFTRSA